MFCFAICLFGQNWKVESSLKTHFLKQMAFEKKCIFGNKRSTSWSAWKKHLVTKGASALLPLKALQVRGNPKTKNNKRER